MKPTGLIKSTAMALALAMSTTLAAAQSNEPIKLTIHDWTGQYVTTHIMGEVLKKAGFNIEYVQATTLPNSPVLNLVTCMLPWKCGKPPARMPWMRRLLQAKPLIWVKPAWDAKEEWWYPSYMKEKCPGLPDWNALNKCAEAFSTPENRTQRPLSGWSRDLGWL